jgi:hypothetical protein
LPIALLIISTILKFLSRRSVRSLINYNALNAGAIVDDLDNNPCNTKHYGALLYIEQGYAVMRCSFCEGIFKNPVTSQKSANTKQKSSRTCISACEWEYDEKTVTCKACSYTGPLPQLPSAK